MLLTIFLRVVRNKHLQDPDTTQAHRMVKDMSQEKLQGREGQSDIMRDNKTKGGVVPENRKWVGGRKKDRESREKTAEKERRKGRCIMIYYIIAEQAQHKWKGL